MEDQRKFIFEQLKRLLASYADRLFVKSNSDTKYELMVKVNFKLNNRTLTQLDFASTVIQKNFTGFYFFPIYSHPSRFLEMPVAMRKKLKGKSCFHITKWDAETENNIKELLVQGYSLYGNIKEGDQKFI